jgi:hypothetical protein
MPCAVCDNTGWVCENHPERPRKGFSKRADACDCGAGAPCDLCNPSDANQAPRMPESFTPTADVDDDGTRH